MVKRIHFMKENILSEKLQELVKVILYDHVIKPYHCRIAHLLTRFHLDHCAQASDNPQRTKLEFHHTTAPNLQNT